MVHEHKQIGKAAVLGAGTMGAQIAAHLANVGWQVLLLDIVPTSLTPEEQQKGLTLQHREVRNRIAAQGLERASKLKPAPFYLPEFKARIEVGNLEDDLPRLKEVDWVLEAVVENLEIKKQLWAQVQHHVNSDALLSTNTSGLSIHEMSEACSEEVKARFLGTHFFNPPRYLKLLEIVPRQETAPEVLKGFIGFAKRVLGKQVVVARDTPGFIANRLGIPALTGIFPLLQEFGLSIEEVDALTGPLIGRPRSATFRLADLVGLDVLASVATHLQERLGTPEEKALFELPPIVQKMLQENRLGEKTGIGFYRRLPDGTIEALDIETDTYRPRQKPRFQHLEPYQNLPLSERLQALVSHDSREGRFLWRLISEGLVYTALHAPELADEPVTIDDAIKWGFNWELGPFEIWDALGVQQVAQRLEQEGRSVPPMVSQMLAGGRQRFYEQDETPTLYVWASGQPRPLEREPEYRTAQDMIQECPKLEGNPEASLLDLGDGVYCAAIHSKMNTLGPSVMEILLKGIERAEQEARGLVITGIGEQFSVGFNLQLFLMMIGAGDYEELAYGAHQFQQALLRLRYSRVPVVAAVFGYTLGGGCEIALHSDVVVAAAETYMGLPEVGVGIIPGGGGTTTMLYRVLKGLPPDADPYPAIRQLVETLGFGKVATSAYEAQKLGFLREGCDRIVINPDRLLWSAKQTVLHLDEAGYKPPQPPRIMAYGDPLYSRLLVELHNLRRGGFLSEHDLTIASQLAYVLTGGDLTQPQELPESYFYRLEVQANTFLAQQPKT
ncbi:MAG: 3-hydroxyacyl-CoA dehydrogenase/enoyl-CoA hydratase family protein, partial [candidate division WOR-3 bacterium]